jgi:hypothetical protein
VNPVAKRTDRWSPDEAFRYVLQFEPKPHRARNRINRALCDDDITLYADGVKVDPEFIEAHLSLGINTDGSAELRMRRAVENFHKIRFELDTAQVEALCSQPADPQQPRAGGRPPRFHWDLIVGELIRMVHEGGVPDTDREVTRLLLNWCVAKWGDKAPEEPTVRERVRRWLAPLRRGQK